MYTQRACVTKTVLSNKNSAGGVTRIYFKFHYRAIVTKLSGYWDLNRHIDQWNRREDPYINPYMSKYVILSKDAKNMHYGKRLPVL